MKKIVLLIISMLTGVNAKGIQELFTDFELGALNQKQRGNLEQHITRILAFNPTKKSSVTQIESYLLPATVLSNTIKQNDENKLLFLNEFLSHSIGSFKSLITYIGNLKSQNEARNFLIEFKKMSLMNNSLVELLAMEIQLCTEIMKSMEDKDVTAFELVALERVQLLFLQDYLVSDSLNPEEAMDCIKELQMYNADKVSLLKYFTSALLIAAPLGAAYLQQVYGNEMAQFGIWLISNLPKGITTAAISELWSSTNFKDLAFSLLNTVLNQDAIPRIGAATVATGIGYAKGELSNNLNKALQKNMFIKRERLGLK